MGRSEAENNTPKLGEDFFTTEAPTTELLGRLAEVSEQVRTRFTEGCETNGENVGQAHNIAVFVQSP